MQTAGAAWVIHFKYILLSSSSKDYVLLSYMIPSVVKLDHRNQIVPYLESYGVNASCAYQQESSLKVSVSLHDTDINKETLLLLGCLCMIWLSTRKQFLKF